MISSYAFSQRFDALSILAGAAWSLWSILRVLVIVLGLAVGLAAVFAAVVAFWLPIAQVCGALAIIAAFGWVTYPRAKAVTNGR